MPLTIHELTAARDFLRQAETLIAGVRSLFLGVSDHATAAKLKNIGDRLADEIRMIERTIQAAKP